MYGTNGNLTDEIKGLITQIANTLGSDITTAQRALSIFITQLADSNELMRYNIKHLTLQDFDNLGQAFTKNSILHRQFQEIYNKIGKLTSTTMVDARFKPVELTNGNAINLLRAAISLLEVSITELVPNKQLLSYLTENSNNQPILDLIRKNNRFKQKATNIKPNISILGITGCISYIVLMILFYIIFRILVQQPDAPFTLTTGLLFVGMLIMMVICLWTNLTAHGPHGDPLLGSLCGPMLILQRLMSCIFKNVYNPIYNRTQNPQKLARNFVKQILPEKADTITSTSTAEILDILNELKQPEGLFELFPAAPELKRKLQSMVTSITYNPNLNLTPQILDLLDESKGLLAKMQEQLTIRQKSLRNKGQVNIDMSRVPTGPEGKQEIDVTETTGLMSTYKR